jgi:D-threonate/D-erythronate kinase
LNGAAYPTLLNRWILAIADDLTGALEAGAKFAWHGLQARVTTESSVLTLPDSPVLVVDTETRHLPESAAEQAVRKVAATASRVSPWLIYKKTDSTLRGNIAAELRAVQDVFPDRALIYAPAYPEMGRTVKNGRLFVWGTPVHQSAFACDPLNPICESDISVVCGNLPAVTVLDGEFDADLRAAACAVMESVPPALAAGPAALAEALAEYLGSTGKRMHGWPSSSRALVVNGSLHPASKAQISYARERGFFDDRWQCFEAESWGSGLERARQTGQAVRHLLDQSPIDTIVVFGGDTAFGIHQALGAPVFESYGEVVKGVPLSFCGGRLWITKAGGFGERDILYDIRRHLT